MLKIRNLNFSYDKIHSLKNINLQVEEPSFITIIGPNGSGKTTLLKNICGLLKSQTGEILFENRNLLNFHRKELSQLVAIVTQNQETIYDYLVEEIVEMGTYVLDKNIEDKKKFLENIYKLTDIEDFVGRSIQTLSSGEKQRVYFARALAQDTPLLLLDEPISNLDLKHQVTIMELCKTLVNKGITVISVLHDINFALNYSDKILIMKNGEVRGFGNTSIISSELIREVFEQEVEFINHNGKIIVIPK